MFLAEREAHFQQFERLVAGIGGGKGGVVLLEGPIATGKTELLRGVVQRANAAGSSCLEATCVASESALPLGVMGQLLRNPVLPREIRELTERLLDRVRPGATEPELLTAIDAACSALLDVSAESPLLIGVDDVRYADPASSRFLLHLVRRLRSAPVLVILTDDGELATRHVAMHSELRRQPHFQRMRLAPLSKDGVTALLAERLGEADAHQLAPELFAASGGNPLLLGALIEDRRDFPGGETPGYGPALLSCLHCADPVVFRVARGVAVLGEYATPDTVRRLLGDTPEEIDRALRALHAGGLLDDCSFRLAAGRSALLDELPRDERTTLHHRTAELLHDRDAPAATLARHLLAAGRVEASWGVGVLVTAADEALVSGEVEQAVAALALAYSSCAGERERAVIQARLAQAEWQLNPAAAARHLAPLTTAIRADRLDRHDGLLVVRQLLWHGRSADATDVLDRIRDSVGDDEPAAELTAAEQWLTSSHPALARKAPGTPVTPARHAARGMDPMLRSTALMADVLTSGRSRDALDQALEVLRKVQVNHAVPWADESALFALLVLISANRSGIAATWCDRLLDDPVARRSPRWRALFTGARSMIAVRLGELTEAARLARAALTHLAPASWGVAVGFPIGSLLLATTRLGRYDEAAKLLTRPMPEEMLGSRYGLPYLYARGDYHLATGDEHNALADFLMCGRLLRQWRLDGAALVPWRAGAAEAWLRLGEHGHARRLIYDELALPGAGGSASRGPALRVLAATQPERRRLRSLHDALNKLEEAGDRYEQARTLLELGRTHHTLGNARQARTALRRAWRLARLSEAMPLCEELQAIDGDLDGAGPAERAPSAGIASLTTSERRVASLAVLGYTNREIADRLRVTASTVEQHLTRVYRKLAVKRRDDLPIELRIQMGSTA